MAAAHRLMMIRVKAVMEKTTIGKKKKVRKKFQPTNQG